MSLVLGVGWYRFRRTLVRRWSGYIGVVLIIGLVGGLAMASIAAARRTQSSYPTFLASTNPSDLSVSLYSLRGGAGPRLTSVIARLPGVKKVALIYAPPFAPLGPTGAPKLAEVENVVPIASLDDLAVGQDLVTVISGRRADANRPDEIMMTPSAAQQWHLGVGQSVVVGLTSGPRVRFVAKVVGIVELNNEIVQDDIDRAYGFVIFSPALMRKLLAMSHDGLAPGNYALKLNNGASDVARVEQEIVASVPRGYIYQFHVTSRVVSQVELAIKPESVALGAFGAIAALVCLVLASQAISRQLSLEDEERRVMRSFGASPVATAFASLIGLILAVIAGALVAFAVAVALSPLAPLGPVRPVYPYRGVAFDWTVLATGLAVLSLGLGAVAVVLAIRRAPHRVRSRHSRVRSSSVARAAESAGFPVEGVVGVRLALEPGRGRTEVPVRSVLLGTVLAVTLVVATLTFASGLSTLVSHPALYGWSWSYTLSPTNDFPPRLLPLLDRDRDVAAWAGVDYTNLGLDGLTVPALIESPHSAVSPPVLSGHGLEADDQVVLGAATLSELGKKVGDTVYLSLGSPRDSPYYYIAPTRLTIVGTATFPAVGFSSTVADHTSMGTGALVAMGAVRPLIEGVSSSDQNLNGPELVLVRLKEGVSPSAGRADMQRIAEAANRVFRADPNGAGNFVSVLGVQRPAQIVNYRSIGSTPVILAAGLAIGAVVALGLMLGSSVRRRRRDLGLLKTLGFTRRQLASAIAWQASVVAVSGVVVGVPLGVAAGRELWTLFARDINAVADPTVPVLAVVLVGVGALLFANLVAAVPGQKAARTPTGVVLRTE